MSAYSNPDVHRSLRRWATAALDDTAAPGEEWNVLLTREEIADSDRPAAIVENAGPVGKRRARSIRGGALTRELFQPWAVVAYPSTEGSARDCKLRAGAVEQTLYDAASVGLVDFGGAERVALWDYDEVGFDADEPGTEDPPADPPVLPYDYLWLDSYNARAIPDAYDDRRFSVVLSLRVSWLAGGRLLPDAELAEGGLLPAFRSPPPPD